MKRIAILAMCLTVLGLMQAETIVVPAVEIEADEQTTLQIGLENKATLPTAWQMVLTLPEGVTIAEREGGGYDCQLSSRHDADSHNLSVVGQAGGRYVLVCYSASNTVLTGQDGTLVSITVQSSIDAKGKTMTGTVTKVVLSDANGVKSYLADTEFQLTVAYPVIHVESASRQYGDENPTFTYTVSGAALRGEPQLTTAALTSSPVGNYPISAERGSIQNAYFEVEGGTLSVTEAPLTIAAGTYTKKQGDAMPEFTLTYDGFKNGETSTVLTKQPVVSCEANEASAPGEYPVTVSGAEAMNYSITYVDGKLTVTEADPVTIMARSYTREYGDANPTFVYDAVGAALNGQPEIICEATQESPVGTYPIVIKKGSVKNYNDTYVNGTLTITPATLSASVGSYSRTEGEENPEFVIFYTGWKNGEDERVLAMRPVVTCEATKDSPAGDYPITVSGGEAQNYTFEYVNGTLTITESSGIDELQGDGTERRIYTISGRRISQPQRGVNIIVTSDGRRVKTMRK